MTAENQETSEKNIWKVAKVVNENQVTNSLYLEGYDEKFANRKAGQFASIRIRKPDGWSQPHPFTISNAPEDPLLRFTIKKAGEFTSAIPDLKPGEPILCMGPLGVFCKDIDAKPLIVMIAGGVGITPFLSVLLHFSNIGASNRVKLFWANRGISDILFADQMKALTQKIDLGVIHCLSREDHAERFNQPQYPDVRYEKGYLSEGVMRNHGVSDKAAFYLCGPPPMMETSLKELNSLGIDPKVVEQEKFSW